MEINMDIKLSQYNTVTLIIILVIGVGCQSGIEISPDTAAIVNDTEIKLSEVQILFDTQLRQSGQKLSSEEASTLKLSILGQLMNDEILMERATEQDLTATDAEVSTRFTTFKKDYTEEKFQEFLKEQETTEEQIKRRLYRTVTIEKLYNKEITSKISVSESEIEEHFSKNKANYNPPEGWRLRHILVTDKKDPGVNNIRNDDATTPDEARKKAKRLMDRLLSGEDFARLAQEYSEDPLSTPRGGDLGFVTAQQLDAVGPTFKRAVKGLKVEQIYPKPIPTNYGYLLLKLIAKEKGGQYELTSPKVQADIRQTIFNRKENILKTAYLQVVRNEAKIRNVLAEKILTLH
jgi:peptidyl-prolyl cis-trans isomerase SurA